MKKIEAIVKSSRVESVRQAIARICVEDPTFMEVTGLGRRRAQTVRYRGAEYRVDLVPMARLDLVVPDEVADRVVAAIFEAARTGDKGDGRIFVLPVEEAIRIRTGERGEAAA